jgi:hypothetical protein
LLAACSKSDKTSTENKTSPLVAFANRTARVDSASTLGPILEARGFKLVRTQNLPAQLSGRRATAAVYRSKDGKAGGVVYMQRMGNETENVTWHWYFSDGAPDSMQLAELNGDGLWDVRVFMAAGTTREFVQGDSFTFMTDRIERVAMNGHASGTGAWKVFDGDTTTAWQAPSNDAYIEVPMPLGLKEGKLRLSLASGSRASKIEIFAADKKVQDVDVKKAGGFQDVDLDASLRDAPSMRIVIAGPASTVSISELEIR